MKKVRIAICTDGIHPHSLGGMQKHSRLLTESLAAHSQFDILVIHPHPQRVFPDTSVKEVSIAPIDPTRNYLLECYKYSRRVHGELMKFNPDVIYSQGLSVWYKANNFRHKLIVNPHGLEAFQATGLRNKLIAIPFKEIFKYIFRRSAAIVSLGGKLTSILRLASPRSTIVEIPNGVSLPAYQYVVTKPSLPVKVLFLARFAHNKGINILFDAIEKMQRTHLLSNYTFTLAGTGPLYNHYLKANKYAEVKLAGYANDEQIRELFTSHHVFVLPTLFEGMPTVVLEAMSYGLPVIVSDVGATNVLVDEKNGRLVTPGNPDEIIAALEELRHAPSEKWEWLSENSRQKVVARFTWEVVARQHADLFTKMVK